MWEINHPQKAVSTKSISLVPGVSGIGPFLNIDILDTDIVILLLQIEIPEQL